MKKLLNLGNVLKTTEQKLIKGGKRGFISGFQCHDNNSFLNPPCGENSDCNSGYYCHLGCSQCWEL